MRRLSLSLVLLAVLAVPAASSAAKASPGDGSLVVKHGQAPWSQDTGDGTPVVVMRITGSVIGEVDSQGKIVIDPGPNGVQPDVTGGVGNPHAVPTDPKGTAQYWKGTGDPFKFRAVGGTFTILIYGTDVNLVAIGKGWVKLAGTPGPAYDGKYSLNGDDFKSLPGSQTDRLAITANG
jgi:hypothetical protein